MDRHPSSAMGWTARRAGTLRPCNAGSTTLGGPRHKARPSSTPTVTRPGAGQAERGAAMAKKRKKNKDSWLDSFRGYIAALVAAIPVIVPAIVAAVASVANTVELRDQNGKGTGKSSKSSKRGKKSAARA